MRIIEARVYILKGRYVSADCKPHTSYMHRKCKGSCITSVVAYDDPHHMFEHAYVARMSDAARMSPAVIL